MQVSRLRSLGLKAGATAFTLGATVVSALYVTAHLKNPSAPLQPAVLSSTTDASVNLPGGSTFKIAPSVHHADVQPVASTHAS
jgi:hypothetical protein